MDLVGDVTWIAGSISLIEMQLRRGMQILLKNILFYSFYFQKNISRNPVVINSPYVHELICHVKFSMNSIKMFSDILGSEVKFHTTFSSGRLDF